MTVDLDAIEQAAERLKDVVRPTPLIYSDFLSREFDADVFIKPENLQRTGTFKLRGAYNKIASLSSEQLRLGIVASSAGNHAQGVAFAAQHFGKKFGIDPHVTIVMPETTPFIKVEGTQRLGAKVVLFGDTYDDAYHEARRIANESKALFVHPFDDPNVIAGQGTIGLEILKELPDLDMILLPVGGGGLLAGVAVAVKSINSSVEIVGVEPNGAACLARSQEEGAPITLPHVETIADGVAVRRVGDLTFELANQYVDQVVTVSDTAIMEALLMLIEREKLISETAGALSVAGLRAIQPHGKKIVCVVSGGNIDVITIAEMLNRGLISRGRLFSFSVELPHKPGELLKVAKILADLRANVIKLDHNQFNTPDRFKSVRLDISVETNGHSHVTQITQALTSAGYSITEIGKAFTE